MRDIVAWGLETAIATKIRCRADQVTAGGGVRRRPGRVSGRSTSEKLYLRKSRHHPGRMAQQSPPRSSRDRQDVAKVRTARFECECPFRLWLTGWGHAVAQDNRVIASEPIGVHQALAHPLANLYARSAAVRLIVRRTAARIYPGDDQNVAADGQCRQGAGRRSGLRQRRPRDAGARRRRLGRAARPTRSLTRRATRQIRLSNEFAQDYLAEHVLGHPVRR